MDLLCFDDVDEYAREIDDPLEELAQDVVHTLLEAYGSNPDAPERGIGLEEMLSGPVDPTLAHRIETMLRDNDDRIDSAKVSISETSANAYRVDVHVSGGLGDVDVAFERDATGAIRRLA